MVICQKIWQNLIQSREKQFISLVNPHHMLVDEILEFFSKNTTICDEIPVKPIKSNKLIERRRLGKHCDIFCCEIHINTIRFKITANVFKSDKKMWWSSPKKLFYKKTLPKWRNLLLTFAHLNRNKPWAINMNWFYNIAFLFLKSFEYFMNITSWCIILLIDVLHKSM